MCSCSVLLVASQNPTKTKQQTGMHMTAPCLPLHSASNRISCWHSEFHTCGRDAPRGTPKSVYAQSASWLTERASPSFGLQSRKMFWLHVALLLVCCTTRSCWAQSNATLTSIPAQPCSGSYNQDVSLYSSDIYTVFANLSLCPDLETNGTVVRTFMEGFRRNHNLPDWSYQYARVAELGFLLSRVWLRETTLVR